MLDANTPCLGLHWFGGYLRSGLRLSIQDYSIRSSGTILFLSSEETQDHVVETTCAVLHSCLCLEFTIRNSFIPCRDRLALEACFGKVHSLYIALKRSKLCDYNFANEMEVCKRSHLVFHFICEAHSCMPKVVFCLVRISQVRIMTNSKLRHQHSRSCIAHSLAL